MQRPLDHKAAAYRGEAVRIATIQYKAGRRDLLWVAQLQTAQLASEATLIKLRAMQRTNRVQLAVKARQVVALNQHAVTVQALGGSFDVQRPAATAIAPELGERLSAPAAVRRRSRAPAVRC